MTDTRTPATVSHPDRRAARSRSAWLSAELRTAALPAIVLAGAVAVIVSARAALLHTEAYARGTTGADASLASLHTVTGALNSAVSHHASLLGLFFVASLAAVVVAGALEGGVWALLRLHENRVWLLVARKLGVVTALAAGSVLVTAATLWIVMRICRASRPLAAPPSSEAPAGVLVEASGPGWHEVGSTAAAALLVVAVFAASSALAAAVTRAVIPAAVLGAAPLTVTLPLVTTDLRSWTPHYWLARWMEFPDGGQWQLYWWSSAPSGDGTTLAACVLVVLGAVAVVAARHVLRAERSLSPRT
ncbi:hypothetical protein [Streptomyces bohaiensis]|uniref:hypothetical protein n=1 Tax=Streptomyces bohaiensis TaxID=1431344 RepID=UPI003B77D06A